MGDLENKKLTLDFVIHLDKQSDKPVFYPISLSLTILLNIITIYILWSSK